MNATEDLVERLRPLFAFIPGASEKKMFGAICFLINGNMCVGPWNGSLIVRLDKKDHDRTQSEPWVGPMDLTGKVMRGWACIEPDEIATPQALEAWVSRAVAYVSTLPPKQ